MTKERLYYESDEDYKAMLDKFFESNVIIQRGENRHPYADVLHAMAEGAESEFSSDNGASWVGVSKELYYCEAYRIKPSEPVYESQYAYDRNNGSAKISEYMTDDEAKISLVGYNSLKLDFTTKERK